MLEHEGVAESEDGALVIVTLHAVEDEADGGSREVREGGAVRFTRAELGAVEAGREAELMLALC